MKQIKHSFISKLTLIISFFVTTHLFAQNGNTSNCNCSQALDEIIHKVETEYPGFSDKTKDTFNYNYYKKQIAEASIKESSLNCVQLIKKYINYFKDEHLNVYSSFVPPNEIYQTETVSWDIEKFKEYCKTTKDSLEGIWNMENYKLGIFKKDTVYIGFILNSKNPNWKPKEIKFKILKNNLSDYYAGNHSLIKDEYVFNRDGVLYFKMLKLALIREFPFPNKTSKELQSIVDEIEGFYIKKISDKTLLIKLKSFAGDSSVKKIKTLFEENKLLLDKYENWIIDIRDNWGGYEASYKSILPYLYTNPIRLLGAETFVTQTLIDFFMDYAKKFDSIKQSEDVQYWKETIEIWKKNIGKFLPYNFSIDNPVTYIKRGEVLNYPKSVVILINKGIASATELFIDEAKQSKKVKLMGQPTAGLFDYTRVLKFNLKCSEYLLYMPTLRLLQAKYFQTDGIGIRPDIFLDEYVVDWVEYARQYLEN